MVGFKPLDPPPCLDLQLLLVVYRDLVDPLKGCGSIGVDGLSTLGGGMSSADNSTLGGGSSTCC